MLRGILVALFGFASLGNAFEILHLSDFHYDPEYSRDGDLSKLCRRIGDAPVTSPHPGPYGEIGCNAPKALVSLAMSEARRLVRKPNLVVWTGDNVPHELNSKNPDPSRDDNYVHNILEFTTDQVYAAYNRTSVILPVFGNHDYAPPDQFELDSPLYEYALKLWRNPISKHPENEALFRRGGYYKYLLPSATVLVLNTNLYYAKNKAMDNIAEPADPAGQFAFMERELKAAAACKPPRRGCRPLVHITAHIPPGVAEKKPNGTWFRPEYNKKLVRLIADYSSSIGWLLFGHHHTDSFHIVRDEKGTPVQLLMLGPAVMPKAANPAFRTYDVDERTGKYNRIKTYYADMKNLNMGKLNFRLEYEMKDAYTLTEGITPKSMDKLIGRMRENDDVLMQFLGYHWVGLNVTRPDPLHRAGYICAVSHADLDDYYACLNEMTSQ